MEPYGFLGGSLTRTQEGWDLAVEISFMAEGLPSHNRTGSHLCVYRSPVLSIPKMKESLFAIKTSLAFTEGKKPIPIRIQSCILVWWSCLLFIF